MIRNCVLVFIVLFLTVFSTGCSFIKEQILDKFIQDSGSTDEPTDQDKEKQRQESGPIPVNPHHS